MNMRRFAWPVAALSLGCEQEAAPEGAVDTIGEVLCTKGVRSGVVGLTPFGSGAFAVTCDGGVVARVTGSDAVRRPAPPASSAAPDKLRPSPRDPEEN